MSAERPELEIREAIPGEIAEVMSIVDAAMLSVATKRVRSLIESGGDEAAGAGAVLLAVEEGRILGVLVLDGGEVEAVAVRPRRRDRGIGSALVEGASERVEGTLVASFDADVLAFYERLGFEVEAVDGEESTGEDRYRGRLA
jgi:GNAT superfamily N-acetyltransferase